ncbi:MAG: epoxide hydrolase 1 [Acidimicrobiia bacterium]|nr:epoxide hydrolase 1 [Acidimicrobiia bacterium]
MRRTALPAVSIALVVAAAPAAQDSDRGTGDSRVIPFTIQVGDDVLADLKARLARTRFPDEIADAGWGYGTSLTYLKELVAYWKDRFDWRAAERRLNAFDQFTTDIDGLRVHFVHQRSPHANAMPIVITHGWPGSFFEFVKVIGPLTDPAAHGGNPADAFHVVALSIPGYGFSERPSRRGYHPERMAEVVAKLMARLGYTRYAVQGGDWGAIISRLVALRDAPHVIGLHLNMCTAPPPPGPDPDAGVPPEELARTRAKQAYMVGERGYGQIQGTRPQTLGYGLNDSPAGLAAWIVEKLRSWSDSNGDVETRFSKDDILTNVTIYWVTETITSSARLYYESQQAAAADTRRVEVPTACAAFPGEVVLPPRKYVEARYNLQRWTEMPRGGHFAAFEEPELFVEDVRAFFRTLR